MKDSHTKQMNDMQSALEELRGQTDREARELRAALQEVIYVSITTV